MIKISVRKCPICKALECEVLHKQRFVLPEGHLQAAGYDVVCCASCGFVFADTTVTQQDYDAFYAKFSKYQDKVTPIGGGDCPWDADRLKMTAKRISEYVSDKDAQIIDIGCANGGILKSLKNLGYKNLLGVDPSISCVENVKDQGIEASVGTLSKMPSDFGNFDCVILSHVLEHVIDVRDAISVIADLLKPKADGFAYIEVPDAARYHEFVISPFQDFNTEHINHFSFQSLSNLFSLNGWSVKESGETEICAAEGIPYPVIYGFFCKDKSVQQSSSKDSILRERIETYIQKSTVIMIRIDRKIKSVLKKTDEVIVWGTGQLAMKLLAETSLGHAKIAAFVDSNPINQGKVLLGTLILSPDQIKTMQLPIIVTSTLHGREIERMIKYKFGLSNKIILL